MKISRELEQRILSMPGVSVSGANQSSGESEPAETKLVDAGVAVMACLESHTLEKLVAFVPVETKSEINGREWKARSRRGGQAWKAVSSTFGPHLDMLAPFARAYHVGRAVRVRFVRLGGRRLDASNLPSATKAVEDAVAFMMGADDGDARWHPEWCQESGGLVGVRVEIEVMP